MTRDDTNSFMTQMFQRCISNWRKQKKTIKRCLANLRIGLELCNIKH